MFRLLRLLTLRSLRIHFLRTWLSTLGIVLGVASILAMGTTNAAALDAVSRLFQDAAGSAHLTVVPGNASEKGISESLLRRIRTYPGVRFVAPSLQGQAVLAKQAPQGGVGISFFGIGVEGGLTLYGVDPALDAVVRQYSLLEGRMLRDAPGEILLVETFANEQNLKVGGRVELFTPSGVQRFQLVGILKREGAGRINNGAVGFVPLKQAQKIFERSGELDRMDVVVEEPYRGVKELESLRLTLMERLGDEVSVVYPSGQGKRMAQMFNSYQIGLNFMSGMALFVGVFLIYNTFSMRVVERKREFGMLRTLGMTNRQVAVLVLAEAGLLGVMGSIAGVALGLLLSVGLARLLSVLLGQDLTISSIPGGVLFSSVVVGLLATLVAASLPAYQASRISPMESLRIRGIQREGWLFRFGWAIGLAIFLLSTLLLVWNPFAYDVQFRLGSLSVFGLFVGGALFIPGSLDLWDRISRPVFVRLYGNSGRLGTANIRRARLRTTLTVAALMMGVAMTVVVRGMTSSFKVDLLDWINAVVGGDIYVGSSLSLQGDVWRRIAAVEGVQAATPIRYVDVRARLQGREEEDLIFMAVDPRQYVQVTRFVFSDPGTDLQTVIQQLEQGEHVLVSSVIADRFGLGVGDVLSLKTSSGWKGFTVAGVVVDFYNQGLTVTGTWQDMRRYFKLSDASAIFVRVQPGTSIQSVIHRMDEQYGERYRLTLLSNETLKAQINTLLNQAFSMFDMLAIIAILVASLGIVNTLTMNVLERAREIGMLRSIGMTREQVAGMILAEAGVMGLFGGLLGLAFGALLSRIFLQAMMAMSNYRLQFVLPVEGLLISLLAAWGISQIAALIPAVRASQIPVLEAIRYE